MASAGRILILPKGNYNAETQYEMLDLVFHNGTSWLAKKDVSGIEPSNEGEGENYWFMMCANTDLTEILQRIAAIENQLLSTASLDDIDLSGYATKTDLANYATNDSVLEVSNALDKVEETVGGLSEDVGGLKTLTENLPTTFSKMQILSYEGNGLIGSSGNACHVTADFPPKVLMMLGYYHNLIDLPMHGESTSNIILCEHLTTSYSRNRGFLYAVGTGNVPEKYAKKSEDGKTIYWYVEEGSPTTQNNVSGAIYYILALG